jgi:hypothetical protein
MKSWLDVKQVRPLWFAECPYKVYMAKVSGKPNLKTICFDVDGKRVYKGEGTI